MEFEKLAVEYIDPKELKVFGYSRDLFPALEGEAYEFLKADIKENGIRTPIEVTKEGLILCGHERQRVALELGFKEVPIIRFGNGSEAEQKIHLIKDNLARKAVDQRTKVRCYGELRDLYGLKHGQQLKTYPRDERGHTQDPKGSGDDFGGFMTHADMAKEVGLSEITSERALRIERSDLPEEIKTATFKGRLGIESVDNLRKEPEEIKKPVIDKLLKVLPVDPDKHLVIQEFIDEVKSQKALADIGVPSVDKQVEQFYGKIAPSSSKTNLPKPTGKAIIQAILKLVESNELQCPVCGEKHLQWRCGHEFQ